MRMITRRTSDRIADRSLSTDGRLNEHPGRQEHAADLPGDHRQGGGVPLRAVPRLRHEPGRRRRRPGRGGTTTLGVPVFDTCAEAVEGDRRQRDDDLRPAAVRGRRDPGGGRRRHRADRRDHRGHPGARHGPGRRLPEGASARRPADRPELPGGHHARPVQDRDHAGLHPQAGPRRRRQPVGHAHLRGGLAAHEPGDRPEHLRRDRRRPGQRHELRRRPRACSRPTRTPTPC